MNPQNLEVTLIEMRQPEGFREQSLTYIQKSHANPRQRTVVKVVDLSAASGLQRGLTSAH